MTLATLSFYQSSFCSQIGKKLQSPNSKSHRCSTHFR